MAVPDWAEAGGGPNDPCILLFSCLGVFVERMQTVSLSYVVCIHKLDPRRALPVYQAPGMKPHSMSFLEGALAPAFHFTAPKKHLSCLLEVTSRDRCHCQQGVSLGCLPPLSISLASILPSSCVHTVLDYIGSQVSRKQ